ncbi:MAG: hypothetical protein MPJ24_08635 [Pirellulaceae bacterium]|nr:hypothetical protein [Pirellulaceae bacterium]
MVHENPIIRLLKQDKRYSLAAYRFVQEGLSYAQSELDYGTVHWQEESEQHERHVSAQELCEGLKQFGISQYGYMAKVVLNAWGVYTTDDFGAIVYNLIETKLMKQSDSDHPEDFNDLYDFEVTFCKQFRFAGESSVRSSS